MTTELAKPRFRGRLHQAAFIVSIPAGAILIALGKTGVARALGAIYAVCISALFGVSSAYHRLKWSPKAVQRMRRLDHSTIYLGIAGTYTPISVLALQGAWRWVILSLVWGGALTGIAIKGAWTGRKWADLIGGILYGVLGWIMVIAIPQVVRKAGIAPMVLIMSGGLLYSVGGILFAIRKPNPNPKVFGYHEIWHSFVTAASACHFAAVMALIVAAH
ncbi:MAG: PAQR family membrane homeostasis protein TrhA [Actinomycetota bacterium]